MNLTDSKNIILNTIREKLISYEPFIDSKEIHNNFYNLSSDLTTELLFKQEITKVNGNCFICNTKNELITNLKILQKEHLWDSIFCIDKEIQQILIESNIPFSQGNDDFANMNVAFTSCEYLIARLGTVMISSKQVSGRKLNIYPPVHLILAYSSQLVKDLDEAFINLKQKYNDNLPSLISIITGPSRTADIEKTLILGAHGPKQLYIFIIKDI